MKSPVNYDITHHNNLSFPKDYFDDI